MLGSYFLALLLLLRHHTTLAFFPPAECCSTTGQTPTSQIIKVPGCNHYCERGVLDNKNHQRSFLLLSAVSNHENNNKGKKKKKSSYNGPALRVVRCIPNISRRKAEQAALMGRVKVDGNVVAPSYRLVGGQQLTLDDHNVDWEVKAMTLFMNDSNGPQQQTSSSSLPKKKKKTPSSSSPFVYYKYHKPVGVTCTMDKHDRRGLFYSLPSKFKKLQVFPVGRLDLDSEGLVLLTNNGPLSDVLLQPRFHHEKEYIVEVQPRLSPTDRLKLESGVVITTVQQRGGQETTKPTQPCKIQELLLSSSSSNNNQGHKNNNNNNRNNNQSLRFVLCEGRNRQIRKMVQAVGSNVVSLRRIRHGNLSLGKLPSGALYPLQDNELKQLLALADSNNKQDEAGW